jgi:hypothetical protein
MRVIFRCLIMSLILSCLNCISTAQEHELKPISSSVPEIDPKSRPELFFYLIKNIDKTYKRTDFESFGKTWTAKPDTRYQQNILVDNSSTYSIYERDSFEHKGSKTLIFSMEIGELAFPEEFYIGNIKFISQKNGWILKQEEYTEFDGKQTAHLIFAREGVKLICSRLIPPLPEHPWMNRPPQVYENVQPEQIKIETISFEIEM